MNILRYKFISRDSENVFKAKCEDLNIATMFDSNTICEVWQSACGAHVNSKKNRLFSNTTALKKSKEKAVICHMVHLLSTVETQFNVI